MFISNYHTISNDITTFNQNNRTVFYIDAIRFLFSKQYKLDRINQLGQWAKLTDKHYLYQKLIKRLTAKKLTSVYRLANENIYHFNCSNPPKYRKAVLVIFGTHQPDKEPNYPLIDKITSFLTVSGVDICFDTPFKPNLETISKHYPLTRYKDTDTYYINGLSVHPLIDKIVFYDKQSKNHLTKPLWRIEASITIPLTNPEYLSLPLYEFKSVIDLACN
jgi:hypothetical protein